MSKVKLKRLLAQKKLRSLLDDLSARLQTPLCVLDATGKPVLGAPAAGGATSPPKHPIEVDGDVVGHVLGDGHAGALASLIGSVAFLDLEKRALAQDTLSRYNELTLIYDMAAKLGNMSDEAAAAAEFARALQHTFPNDHVGILLTSIGEAPQLLYAAPDDALLQAVCQEAAAIHEVVRSSGRAEIVNEVAADSRGGGATSIASMMCAPLKCVGDTFGLVHVGQQEPCMYTTEQLALFSTLTFQHAAVMENRRLHARAAKQRAALLTMARAMEEALSDEVSDS